MKLKNQKKSFNEHGLSLIVVLLCTFAAFSSTLNNGWTNWDDPAHVTENPTVVSRDIFNIPAHFTTNVLNQYIPLTSYSFALEYFFFGADPFIYHLTNLLLHLAITALIFSCICRLKFSALTAFFGALLFGIHPIHVESVAWITERKDVLYAFFYMLSLWSYLKYINCQSRKAFTISLFWGLLSVLSKPMALSLPLICLLCDWYLGRRIDAKVVLEKGLYFLYIIPIAAITYFLHSRVPGESVSSAMLIWLWSSTFYLDKFVTFWDLSPYYVFSRPVTIANYVYAKGVVLFLTTIAMLWVWRKNCLVVFAFLFYFLSNFFMFKFDAGDVSVVADRYMYLPSVGFCILLGFLMERFLKNLQSRKNIFYRLGLASLSLIFVAMGIVTFKQVNVWASSASVWSEVVRKSPQAAKGYANLGGAFVEEEKYAEAIPILNRAIEIDSNEFRALSNRGYAYARLGELQQALHDYTRALHINPEQSETLNNRGNLYKVFKRFDLAMKDFNQAIKLNPYDYRAFSNRGILFAQQRRFKKSLDDFNQAITLKPDQAEIYQNRGLTYFKRSEFNLALADFDKALALNPQYADAFFNRARVYLALNQMDKAKEDARQAVKLNHPHAGHILNTIN